MSLFSNSDTIARAIESWRGFRDTLSAKKRTKFDTMLAKCYEDIAAINAKSEPFANEPLIMSLLLHQKEMIDWLVPEIAKVLAINAELTAKLQKVKT